MQDAVYDIISKSLTGGQLTQQEQQELDAWLRVPANADEYAELVSVWNLTGKVKYTMDVDVDAEWESFRQITAKRRVLRPRFMWIAAAAASIALLISIYAITPSAKTDVNTYVSANKIEKIVLPDSSEVILNKNSKLTYKYNASRHQRNVTLTGEAMFKVRHTGDDFVVGTKNKVYTKVLGTIFNVKAYEGQSNISLAVIEGKVEFGSRRSNKVVECGQQASFDCEKKQLMPTDTLDTNNIAWNTGSFVFNGKAMSKVASQIGTYLNKKVVLPEGTQNLQYTGRFENPTSEVFAEIVATAMNWEYKITDTEIVFSKR